MKRFRNVPWAAFIAAFCLAIVTQCADAARLGGGKSFGAQRSITQSQRPTPPSAAQAAPAPAPAAAPAGNRWLGPLAGLAAGLGLGFLFANGGAGAFMGPILMALVAGFIIMMLVRMLSRPKPQPAYGGTGGPGYARPASYGGLGNETVAAPPPSQLPGNDSAWGGQRQLAQPAAPGIPPGFDTAGFLKQAKLNFIRLQEANDSRDLDSLRDVTTDTLYQALLADLNGRGSAVQHTDVVTLDAALLEVVTENDAHWASVKFSGQIREQAGAAPTPFAEVWHLSKPVDGQSGWLIAGIEQIS